MSKRAHNGEGEIFPVEVELLLSQNGKPEIIGYIDNFKMEIIDSLENLLVEVKHTIYKVALINTIIQLLALAASVWAIVYYMN